MWYDKLIMFHVTVENMLLSLSIDFLTVPFNKTDVRARTKYVHLQLAVHVCPLNEANLQVFVNIVIYTSVI
jgi:hypothetical protein